MKQKGDKLGYIKSKYICSATYSVKRIKWEARYGERVIAKHILDNELVFGIYKENLKLNKKTNNRNLKWPKHKHTPHQRCADGKGYLTSFVIREIQIKTTTISEIKKNADIVKC